LYSEKGVLGGDSVAAGARPTRDNHPFHLHVNHFQIVSASFGPGGEGGGGSSGSGGGGSSGGGSGGGGGVGGGGDGGVAWLPDWQVGDWRDTITVPAPGNVTVRWRADDFTGVSLAHCHLFSHADTGMAVNFEVVDQQEGHA
jgi:FtsP/CotA-like multicopper oxidase with cupredoxin domain